MLAAYSIRGDGFPPIQSMSIKGLLRDPRILLTSAYKGLDLIETSYYHRWQTETHC